jgi:hypothetical protein
MVEEFQYQSVALSADATRCVGSSARLDAVFGRLTAMLTRIDPQFARSLGITPTP